MKPILVLIALLVSTRSRGVAAEPLPNFVLMMGDDHGWEETGYNRHPHVKTPVLDERPANPEAEPEPATALEVEESPPREFGDAGPDQPARTEPSTEPGQETWPIEIRVTERSPYTLDAGVGEQRTVQVDRQPQRRTRAGRLGGGEHQPVRRGSSRQHVTVPGQRHPERERRAHGRRHGDVQQHAAVVGSQRRGQVTDAVEGVHPRQVRHVGAVDHVEHQGGNAARPPRPRSNPSRAR